MSIFHSLIRKEVLHLLRDPRTVTVVLVMPVVLLLLFGFAISTEVNGIRLLAVVGQHTDETHRLLERFRSNPCFTLEGIVAPHEADDLLRQGKADAVLVLRTDGGQPRTPTWRRPPPPTSRASHPASPPRPSSSTRSTIRSSRAPTSSCPASWG